MSLSHEKTTGNRLPHALALFAALALTAVFGAGLFAAAGSPGTVLGRSGAPQGIITVEVLGV